MKCDFGLFYWFGLQMFQACLSDKIFIAAGNMNNPKSTSLKIHSLTF